MQCFALGKQTGNEEIIWHTSPLVSLFFKPIAHTLPAPMVDRLNEMQSQEMIELELVPHKHAYAYKLDNRLILVCCAMPLNTKQMQALWYNMFIHLIPLDKISANLVEYCKLPDSKILAAKQNLQFTKEVMEENIDKAILRGGQLKETEEKARNLHLQARVYKVKAEELNSCWPQWSSYCNLL